MSSIKYHKESECKLIFMSSFFNNVKILYTIIDLICLTTKNNQSQYNFLKFLSPRLYCNSLNLQILFIDFKTKKESSLTLIIILSVTIELSE